MDATSVLASVELIDENGRNKFLSLYNPSFTMLVTTATKIIIYRQSTRFLHWKKIKMLSCDVSQSGRFCSSHAKSIYVATFNIKLLNLLEQPNQFLKSRFDQTTSKI